jgi:uncharacterized protein YjbJ (UPF0337 family)
MRASRILLTGIGVGAALTYALFYDPKLQREARFDSADNTAKKARLWSAQERFRGEAETLAGQVKEGVGRVTNDDDLMGEGIAEQTVGAVRDTAGRWGNVAGETINNLNR